MRRLLKPIVMQQQATIIARWAHSLRTHRRLSEHTTNAYVRDIKKLIALQPETSLADYTSAHIRQSLAQLHAAGEQPRTLARRLSAWRHFFNWHQKQQPETHATNPCDGVRAPKAPTPLPKALSVEQTQQLLEQEAPLTPPGIHLSAKEKLAYRDQALFELFYSCGLRLNELVGLDYRYIDNKNYQSKGWLNLAANEIRVQGKGQKSRILPIGKKALQALKYWLQLRTQLLPTLLQQQPERNWQHSAALFLGQRGRRIHPRVVQAQLAKRAQKAGLTEHVHPHRLRHSFASHILQSSQDLRAVQELLGHSSIRSTQIYTRLDFQHLAKVYDQAHPRAIKKNSDNKD